MTINTTAGSPAISGQIMGTGGAADKCNKDERLRTACAEFESLFISQLLKGMRDSIPKTPLFHGGLNEEIYTSMFDQELAMKMAEKGIGLGEQIFRQFSESRENVRSETPYGVNGKLPVTQNWRG
ncbi:MAG: rod-binding protein [Pseudomonadota bacterium]